MLTKIGRNLAFLCPDAQLQKEVIQRMLEGMHAPHNTATNEEYKTFDDNNDFGHMIPIYLKKG